MLCVGVDWAEDHHDVCVMDPGGEVLGQRRVADSVRGVGDFTRLWCSTRTTTTRKWSWASGTFESTTITDRPTCNLQGTGPATSLWTARKKFVSTVTFAIKHQLATYAA